MRSNMQVTSLAVFLVTCCVLGFAVLIHDSRVYTSVGQDDRAFSDHVVFDSPARSVVNCALRCTREGPCVSFTYHEKTCRGLGVKVNGTSNSSAPAPGARTFASSAFVRYSACTTNLDCLGPDVECFKGKCLCTPGYFYSLSARACKQNCSSLLSTYTEYPGSGLIKFNEQTLQNATAATCTAFCTADPLCVNCELTQTGRCHTHYVTALTETSAWSTNYPTWWGNFFQRDCA